MLNLTNPQQNQPRTMRGFVVFGDTELRLDCQEKDLIG